MDVTLVLTHRCNLACTYCYAGDHHRAEMSDAIIARAVDLLFADAEVAQLSFFGGEPFLAFDAMKRAVAIAEARAAALGKTLLLQCTTNATLLGPEEIAFLRQKRVRVTVSIDGIREAHEVHRRSAGGGSTFDRARMGLAKLIEAGVDPEALMVVTPETSLFAFRSVKWLWSEGVRGVRMNFDVARAWDERSKQDLVDELTAVGRELVHRRILGARAVFFPFERSGGCGSSVRAPRQVVVATTGNLYPCGPMVGEDRDHGPEAATRIGHLDDGIETIIAALDREGASCSAGGACACAAFLETGDRATQGSNSRWFARVCAELGQAVRAALEEARPIAEVAPRPKKNRRALVLVGVALGTGSIAAAAAHAMLSTQGAMTSRNVEQQVTPQEQPKPVETAQPAPLPTTIENEPSIRVTGGVMVHIDEEPTIKTPTPKVPHTVHGKTR